MVSIVEIWNRGRELRKNDLHVRCLFLCSPATVWGGGQQYLYRVWEAMAQEQWNTLVVFPEFHQTEDFVRELRARGCKAFVLPSTCSVFYFFYLFILIVAFRPKLIHLNGLNKQLVPGIVVGRVIPGIKLCMTSHLEFFSKATEKKIISWGKRSIFSKFFSIYRYHAREWLRLSLLLRFCDKIIFVNQFYGDKYCNIFSLNKKMVEVICNGVDTDRFKPDLLTDHQCEQMRENLGISPRDFVVCGVGGLTPQKRFDVFIDVVTSLFSQHRFVVGLIVGAGPLELSLKEQVRKTGMEERIVFLGRRSDVPELLNVADCFFMPSGDEGLPYALLEAKASGLPSVATDVGGIPEVIQDQTDGYLVGTCDKHRMVSFLSNIITNQELRKRMGKCATNDVLARFSLSEMQAKTVSLFKSLVER